MYSLLKILTCLLIQWCIFYIRKVGRFLSPPLPPPPNNKAAARPSLLLWRIFHYLLQELEEIYIDTSNTVNIAMESHALMLLTKVRKTTLAQSKWDNSVITVRLEGVRCALSMCRFCWLSSFWSTHFHTNNITLRYLIRLNLICHAAKYRVTWGLKNSSWGDHVVLYRQILLVILFIQPLTI